jgi:TP901 family phage tail tape measure protein
MAGTPLTFDQAFINPDDFGAGINKLKQGVDSLSESFTTLGKKIQTDAVEVIKNLKKEISELAITQDDARKKLEAYQKQVDKLVKENAKLSQEFKKYEKTTKEAKTATEELEQEFKKLTNSTERLNKAKKKKFETMGQMLVRYARTTFIVTQLYQGYRRLEQSINDSFLSFVQLDQQLQAVRAVTGAADKDFERIAQQARNLGASTEYTALQIATLQKELAKLGFTTQEIVMATRAITDLATASGEDLAASARIAASTLRAFNLDASETERLVNVMAGSFVRSGLNLEKFSESMKFVAPVANALNVDVETTTVLLSKLADAGLRGTQAGTSLRNIFSDLASPTSKLAQRLGFTVNNSEELITAFQKLSEEGVEFADVAGLVDLTARQQFQIFLQQAGSLKDLQTEYRNLDQEGRRLAFMMRDTLANDIEIMNSAMDGLGRNLIGLIDRMGRFDQDGSNFRDFVSDSSETITWFSNQMREANGLLDLFTKLTFGAVGLLIDLPAILLNLEGGVRTTGRDLMTKVIPSLNNTKVALDDAKKETTAFLSQIEQLRVRLSRPDSMGNFLKNKAMYTDLMGQAEASLRSLVKEQDAYELQIETIKNKTEGLTSADLRNLLALEKSLTVVKTKIAVFKDFNIELTEATKNLDSNGKAVLDYQSMIAKLKAVTEENIAVLERQAQVNDTTFVQMANTVKKTSQIRIDAINKEQEYQQAILDLQKQIIGEDIYNLKVAELNAKTRAAILKEQIGVENNLRQLRQRQINLTNRETVANINTEIKQNQLLKDNQISSYDERLNAARDYYEGLNRLLTIEEDRAREILNQKERDNLLTKEEIQAERVEMEQDFLRRRLDLNQNHFDELFKLEMESTLRQNKVLNENRDLDLTQDEANFKILEAQSSRRLNRMAIERRGLEMFHARKKELFEEERDIQIRLLNTEAEISRQRISNKLDNELVMLELALERGEYLQDEYEQIRLKKMEAYRLEVEAINEEMMTNIIQVNDNIAVSIAESFAEAFESVAQKVSAITSELFRMIDNKRRGELDALKRWEDSRLEYVRGNAEAEALVRLQAEQKRVEIERKQAKANRDRSLFEIALNTAVAISKASTLLPPASIAQIAFATALGAAQTAAVLSTPLPEFYKGTSNAPEGLAKVDERGQELIYRKKRNTLELGQKGGTRVTYLDKGDQVFTARQTKELLNDTTNLTANNHIGNKLSAKSAQPIKVTDEDKIINGVARALSNLPITQTNMDERGFTKYLANKNKRVSTLNKRYKF